MMLLVALITLGSLKANGTESMSRAMVQLLKYFSTHPDTVIRYKKKRHDYLNPR